MPWNWQWTWLSFRMNAVRPSRRRTAQQWMESQHGGRDGFRRLVRTWSRSSVQRLATDSAAPTQGFADGLLASAGIGSVGLKNETVIRPTHAFLRSRAWDAAAPLGHGTTSARRSGRVQVVDQSSIRNVIHLHGSAPDRKSRAVPG